MVDLHVHFPMHLLEGVESPRDVIAQMTRVRAQEHGKLRAAVFALAARAAADCTINDLDRDAFVRLQDLRARATSDPFAGVRGDTRGWRNSWDAELARLSGDEALDVWVLAAAEWDRITRPHEAAYCRWRGAQAALRDGQGTLADRLLRRAASDAREHVPLHRAIRAIAGAR